MIVKIMTANHHKKNYRGYIEAAIRARLGTLAPRIPWDKPDPAVPPVLAWVYEGYLVASCECGGNIFYEPGEVFFCPDCLNLGTGGQPRTVLMPEGFAEGEQLLVQRPNLANRNWLRGETLADLIAENIEHAQDLEG